MKKLIIKDCKETQLGDIVYSDFMDKFYTVSFLPFNCEQDYYALIRLDGEGYYYLSKSMEELIEKIRQDRETTVFKPVEHLNKTNLPTKFFKNY